MSKSASTKRSATGWKSTSAPIRSKSAHELWLDSVKAGTGGLNSGRQKNKPHPGKKTPDEFWTGTLRKTGSGLNSDMPKSTSGLNKTDGSMAYLSTSHYMRQMAGTEKGSKNGPYSPNSKPAAGTPAYKTPEEYYELILDLKKQIGTVHNENTTMKSKIRRLEEDNLKKEQEIANLLDPSKSNDMRRTLGTGKDSPAVIYSLKQKIMKLENQVKDREGALSKVQSDLKTTKVEEMKIQLERCYQEIVRLQNVGAKSAMSKQSSSSPSKGDSTESQKKINALSKNIVLLNDQMAKLKLENKGLMVDLEKIQEERNKENEVNQSAREKSKKDLVSEISKLKKKISRLEGDNVSIISATDSRHGEKEGKIVLSGTVGERLDQLDKRETELLEQCETLKASIKKLKSNKKQSAVKLEEKDKEIAALKKVNEELRKLGMERPPSRRPDSGYSGYGATSDFERQRKLDSERQKKVEQMSQNHAAKTIQQSWRKRHHKVQTPEEGYHSGEVVDSDDEDAITVQSALRGHKARRHRQKDLRDISEISDEDEENAVLVQAALRGHVARRKRIGKERSYAKRDDTYLDSGGEEIDIEDNDDGSTLASSRSGRASPARYTRPKAAAGARRRSSATSSSPRRQKQRLWDQKDDDEDDDDDIQF